MIRSAVVFLVIVSFQRTGQDEGEVTLNVRDRVELLKRQIYDEIDEDQKAIVSVTPSWIRHQKSAEMNDNYEYKDEGQRAITPIMDFDERKFKDRFKHKPLYTKHPTTFQASPEDFNVSPIKHVQRSRKKKKKRILKAAKPKEIFYRRAINYDEPALLIHRHDLLTPFIMSGESLNTSRVIVEATDSNVLRLVHLISEDTRESTKDEIYSILYQISNIPIRLFQWEAEAVMLLFDQLMPEERQNFHILKRGLKDLFANWHLDIGNVSNLLRQTRIFRPPCIMVSELSGSTKKPKGAIFTKTKKAKRTCPWVIDTAEKEEKIEEDDEEKRKNDSCEY